MEHVVPHHPHKQRNDVFCWVRSKAIPLDHARLLDVIFGKRITWRLSIEMTEAKAFSVFIRIYSLFRSERLSASVKLNFHNALIR
jgi:hypothetical protein